MNGTPGEVTGETGGGAGEQARLYSIGEVAGRFGVPRWRIEYLFESRRLPEPPRIANRRVFRDTDISRIAALLAQKEPARVAERRGDE